MRRKWGGKLVGKNRPAGSLAELVLEMNLRDGHITCGSGFMVWGLLAAAGYAWELG